MFSLSAITQWTTKTITTLIIAILAIIVIVIATNNFHKCTILHHKLDKRLEMME